MSAGMLLDSHNRLSSLRAVQCEISVINKCAWCCRKSNCRLVHDPPATLRSDLVSRLRMLRNPACLISQAQMGKPAPVARAALVGATRLL
jgi:hypothetical protein